MPQGLKAPRAWRSCSLLVALLAACGAYSRDIEAVKQSNVPTGIVNEELVKQFAGARGKIDWSAEQPEKYKDNENIVLVRATIDRDRPLGSQARGGPGMDPQPPDRQDRHGAGSWTARSRA